MNHQMLKWAEARVSLLGEKARVSQNAFRVAQRDLESIKKGNPTGACLDRYYDWVASKPKPHT